MTNSPSDDVPEVYAKNRELLKKNALRVCDLCWHRIKKEDLSVDHIVPLSRGGTHHLKNLRLLHSKCNQIKGNLLDEEFPWPVKAYFWLLKLITLFYQ